MRSIPLRLALVVLLVACSPIVSSTSDSQENDLESILAEYQNWVRVTPQPLIIPSWLWGMCDIPAGQAARLASPHSDRYSNVYVNEAGAISMAQAGERLFPEGSIIVKEKLLQADDSQAVAIGIMIKREDGYNPEGGGWEYAYWEGEGSIQRGMEQVRHCQDCHIGVSFGSGEEDYYSQLPQMEGSGMSREVRDSVFTTLLVSQGP